MQNGFLSVIPHLFARDTDKHTVAPDFLRSADALQKHIQIRRVSLAEFRVPYALVPYVKAAHAFIALLLAAVWVNIIVAVDERIQRRLDL